MTVASDSIKKKGRKKEERVFFFLIRECLLLFPNWKTSSKIQRSEKRTEGKRLASACRFITISWKILQSRKASLNELINKVHFS